MKIVYNATRSWYQNLMPSITSLLDHNDPEVIYITAEDDEIPGLPDVCKVVNVSDQPWIRRTSPNWKSPYSWMVLIRVCYPEIFRDEEKILQLDADTIVCGSLRNVWNTDMDGKWIAAVDEKLGMWKPYGTKYYNLGVCLFNLEQMRQDKAMEQLVRRVNAYHMRFPEQDAINELAIPDKVVELPTRYNESFCCGYTKRPAVIHYAGIPDWRLNPTMFRHEYLMKYASREPARRPPIEE